MKNLFIIIAISITGTCFGLTTETLTVNKITKNTDVTSLTEITGDRRKKKRRKKRKRCFNSRRKWDKKYYM
mgnify:CR=1 FL=1